MQLSDELRLERLKLKMSQFTLSRLTGIPASSISKFENGWIEFSEEKIQKVKSALEYFEKNRSV